MKSGYIRICKYIICIFVIQSVIWGNIYYFNFLEKSKSDNNKNDYNIQNNLKSSITIVDGINFNEDNIKGDLITGSGIIFSKDGYAITNYHVVKTMTNMNIILYDNSFCKGKIISFDEDADIAIIKIEKNNLIPAQFEDTSILKLGDSVIAIGTPMHISLRNSISTGIISGLERIGYSNFKLIQTDLASNTGCSGGPLINLNGKVIGMNSFKYQEAGSEGLTFSIASKDIIYYINMFHKYGVLKKIDLGIDFLETPSQKYGINTKAGLKIINVKNDSLLTNYGIKSGDIIKKINNTNILNKYDYFQVLRTSVDRNILSFIFERDNAPIVINIPVELLGIGKDDPQSN